MRQRRHDEYNNMMRRFIDRLSSIVRGQPSKLLRQLKFDFDVDGQTKTLKMDRFPNVDISVDDHFLS
jgi:hypothetical protein